MHQLAAGIDIGGTNTRFGLVDKNGKIHFKDSLLTTDFPDPKDLVNAVSEKILSFSNPKQQTTNFKLLGVGIGAPNGNYLKGTI
jgi:glucokinase